MDVRDHSPAQAEIVLTRTEVLILSNVLAAAERWPLEAVGPKAAIRALRDHFDGLQQDMGT